MATQQHVVKTTAYHHVKYEGDRLVERKRYQRGDVVVLDTERGDTLVRLGSMAPHDPGEAEPEPEAPQAPAPAEDQEEATGGQDDATEESQEEAPSYDGMQYGDLQNLARQRGLPYNSISKADLITSLQHYDSVQAANAEEQD